MLDESSLNGLCQSSPITTLDWKNGHLRQQAGGRTHLGACGPNNAPTLRVALSMAVHLTQPGDFFLVPKASEQTAILPCALHSNKT